MFLPHFDYFCDLLLKGSAGKWNLFVLYNKEVKNVNFDLIYASVVEFFSR